MESIKSVKTMGPYHLIFMQKASGEIRAKKYHFGGVLKPRESLEIVIDTRGN